MRKRLIACVLCLTAVFVAGGVAVGDEAIRLHIGGRYHTASTVLPFLPYDDGDVSGSIGIELKDATGYWQFLLNGMESPGDETSEASRILTPQINMFLQDKAFLAGVGVLRSHVRDREEGGGWTRFYFQLSLGLEFDMSDHIALTGFVVYPFKSWDSLGDFKGSDLEYAAGVSYRF